MKMARAGPLHEASLSYFPHHLPAQSAFAIDVPVLGTRIELACTATRTETP